MTSDTGTRQHPPPIGCERDGGGDQHDGHDRQHDHQPPDQIQGLPRVVDLRAAQGDDLADVVQGGVVDQVDAAALEPLVDLFDDRAEVQRHRFARCRPRRERRTVYGPRPRHRATHPGTRRSAPPRGTVFSITFLAALVTVASTRALSRGVNSWIRSWTTCSRRQDLVGQRVGDAGGHGLVRVFRRHRVGNVSVSKTKVRAYTPSSDQQHQAPEHERHPTRARAASVTWGEESTPSSDRWSVRSRLLQPGCPTVAGVPVADLPREVRGPIGGTAHWCAMRRAISASWASSCVLPALSKTSCSASSKAARRSTGAYCSLWSDIAGPERTVGSV